jgi:hypothetical protein
MRISFITALGLITVSSLGACSGKDAANESNFGSAIRAHLQAHGRLCLGFKKWPVDLPQGGFAGTDGSRMAALEHVGLVAGHDAEGDADPLSSFLTGRRKKTVRRYGLTDEGKRFFVPGAAGEGDVCYGTKALARVVKWEGPIKLGDFQEASVKCTYGIEGLAAWAKDDDIRKAFPSLARVVDGAGSSESRYTVKLTSEGWEVKGGLFDGPIVGY